jgi:drug/metabolite transporter (DMT)-like permease
MEPVFSAIIARIFLNEKFSPFALLGSFLMMSGLLVSELSDLALKNRESVRNFLSKK